MGLCWLMGNVTIALVAHFYMFGAVAYLRKHIFYQIHFLHYFSKNKMPRPGIEPGTFRSSV